MFVQRECAEEAEARHYQVPLGRLFLLATRLGQCGVKDVAIHA